MVDGMQEANQLEADKSLIGESKQRDASQGRGTQRKSGEKANIFGAGRRNSARGSDGGSRAQREQYAADEEAFEFSVSSCYKSRNWQQLEAMAVQRLEVTEQRPSAKGFFYFGVALYKQ
jgi:hypothetical protein